jgi:hypothetical protein
MTQNTMWLRATEARLNVTWNGQNGDLADAVSYAATDMELKTWAMEAIRSGTIAGIRADLRCDLSDFVVDRFTAGGEVPYNRVFVRPKTPFGTVSVSC